MAAGEPAAPPEMTEPMPTEAPASEPAESGGTSVFISADALGGRQVKPGQTITLTVRAVDEETGEVEAVPAEASEPESKPAYESAMDEEMPEE